MLKPLHRYWAVSGLLTTPSWQKYLTFLFLMLMTPSYIVPSFRHFYTYFLFWCCLITENSVGVYVRHDVFEDNAHMQIIEGKAG